jgi:hypothetical protein
MSILNLSRVPASFKTPMTLNNSDDEDDKLTPAQAQIVARVRWLMLLSGVATMLGIAVVVSIVGYRVFRTEGIPTLVEATARLPKGARIVSIGTAGDRIAVTVDIGGTTEVRIFDAKTLSQAGRLRFAEEP